MGLPQLELSQKTKHLFVRSFRLNRHSFPLLYTYQENGMGLSVGPVLNLNVRPRIYNTYLNAEGKEQQDADKSGIHFTPATLSFYGE